MKTKTKRMNQVGPQKAFSDGESVNETAAQLSLPSQWQHRGIRLHAMSPHDMGMQPNLSAPPLPQFSFTFFCLWSMLCSRSSTSLKLEVVRDSGLESFSWFLIPAYGPSLSLHPPPPSIHPPFHLLQHQSQHPAQRPFYQHLQFHRVKSF